MPPTQAPTGLDPTVAAQRLRDEGANELGISQRRTLRCDGGIETGGCLGGGHG